MRTLRVLLHATLCSILLMTQQAIAQSQPGANNTPTIQVTSSLVFLDVTVLDKKGHPVVTGLTKDDFTITENNKTQRIFSFEAPETHTMAVNAGDDNPDGKAPVTIFVLDLLNSNFEDFAFIRYSVHKYLAAQPMQLSAPAELLVIGNQSLEMLQGYTRNKEDLLFALDHLPSVLPYKKMNGAFFWERLGQSIDALQQIALQNKGVPGRKNIIWVGHGGPGVNTAFLPYPLDDELKRYVHETTNMLVDARMSLFAIYPGLKVEASFPISAMDAAVNIGDDDPFAGDVNFGVFVNETGGKLFYNRNDVDQEMKQSEQWGSEYYTLTYQPHDDNPDGKFRRIRVTVRDGSMRAVTKAGYFAQEKGAPVDVRQQTTVNLSEAARSTIPFSALDVKIADVARHPDTRTAEMTVLLKMKNVDWQATEGSSSTADVMVAAASLSGRGDILASKVETLALTAATQNPVELAKMFTPIKLTIRLPRKTHNVRVVVETAEGGRIGSADLDRHAIDAAPEAPTPEPQLVPRSQYEEPSTSPPPPKQ